MGFFDELKKIFNIDVEGDGKNTKLIRKLLILGMLGTLLLLFANVFVNPNNNEQNVPVSPYQSSINEVDKNNYEKKINEELEEIISLIRGVGKVKVNVYVSRYEEYEYEYNSNQTNKITSETDQNGGQREIVEDNLERELVVIKDTSGNEKPVIRKELNPVIEGVLIVAQGSENSYIKYEIIKSISKLLNIPIHKISVLPYERG